VRLDAVPAQAAQTGGGNHCRVIRRQRQVGNEDRHLACAPACFRVGPQSAVGRHAARDPDAARLIRARGIEEPLDELEVILSWTTTAMTGSEEPVEVDSKRFVIDKPKGSLPFRFELPQNPWSFEGKLFSVKWSLGVDGLSNDARTEIVVSPTGQPIRPSAPA
jgi:hypothetical protein